MENLWIIYVFICQCYCCMLSLCSHDIKMWASLYRYPGEHLNPKEETVSPVWELCLPNVKGNNSGHKENNRLIIILSYPGLMRKSYSEIFYRNTYMLCWQNTTWRDLRVDMCVHINTITIHSISIQF